jgi:hypothetical protein
MAESRTIRWLCAKRVVELLRERPGLEGVQIEPGFPGDTLEDQAVWIDELDGDIEVPVSKGVDGIVARDDNFTVPFEVRVVGLADLDDTMTRLSEIVAEIELCAATDSQLGQLDGVVTARVTGERFTAAQIKGVGYVGFAEVVITVLTAFR